MSPSEVESCSLWQFSVAVDGWLRANGVEQRPDMLSDDAIEQFERIIEAHG